MSKRVLLRYTNNGEPYVFPFDLDDSHHRTRIFHTLKWAVKVGIAVSIEADREARAVESSDSAGLARMLSNSTL